MEARTPEELSALYDAFRDAEYRVEIPGAAPVLLAIDTPSAELEKALAKTGARTWAIITAWNPDSQQQSEAENRNAQRALEQRLEHEGWAFWPSRNQARGGAAYVEPSCFVLGPTPEKAAELGRDFGQVAVVWGERGQAPRLLSCALGEAFPGESATATPSGRP